MSWKLSPALEQLRQEVNEYARKRNKSSDGTIGDADHSSRVSDHNPNAEGIVCALDLTHDPDGGFDAHKFARLLAKRCRETREQRVNYIISNGKIASNRTSFRWVDYDGASPHNKHVHISVFQIRMKYNSDRRWWVSGWMPRSVVKKKKVENADG